MDEHLKFYLSLTKDMPVALTENIHQTLKMVNGGEYTVKQFIPNPNWTVYMLEADVFLVNGPPKTIFVSSPTTKNIHLRGLPPGIIPLLPTKVYASKETQNFVRKRQFDRR
ncbi:hypothetical protein F4804DRAFT_308913 [Jackrogersella minutella]|nr:hypothetical protein F4804DRAFT_308913 [Jackrogersella minutella]